MNIISTHEISCSRTLSFLLQLIGALKIGGM